MADEGIGVVVQAGKEFKQLATNDLKEKTYASPAIADGRLYIRTWKHLYCIGAKCRNRFIRLKHTGAARLRISFQPTRGLAMSYAPVVLLLALPLLFLAAAPADEKPKPDLTATQASAFAKLALKGGARLEQIQLSLGHQSIQTTQRYLGLELDLQDAPCDHLGLSMPVVGSA